MSASPSNTGVSKGVAMGVVLTLGILAVGAWVAIQFGLLPVNADARPSWLERRMAGTARDAAVARQVPTEENPVKLSDDNLMQGMKLYQRNCQECHGAPEASENPFAKALYPSAPQFPPREDIDLSEQELYWIGKHGFRLTGIPGFTHILKDEELWQTALFIKHMNKLPATVLDAWKHSSSTR